MVVKRDFDKVLVNLLRTSKYFVNIALIDAEGIPISFAVKSRQYQIKPATLGSKTKILLYLSKTFAKANNLQEPIVQVLFFEKIAVMVVNLKVINFFILMDLKGWPPNGKLLYENFISIKRLLTEVEKSKDDALKSLFEGDEKKEYNIADISDTFIKIIAKNINSLNQIQVSPLTLNSDGINFTKDDEASFSKYLQESIVSDKIIKGTIIKEDGTELFVSSGTSKEFTKGIQNLIKNSFKELETFKLGNPSWMLNIFEKSELMIVSKFGKISNKEVYSGLLMENRLGNLKEIINLIYRTSSEVNLIQSNPDLNGLIQSIEYIGFSADELDIKIEKALIKGKNEEAGLLMERAANLFELDKKFSNAGIYYSKLGKLSAKDGDIERAGKWYQQAASLHLKDKNFEKAGDELFNLGKLETVSGNLSKVLENYDIALKYYKKSGTSNKIQKIEYEIKKIGSIVRNQLKDYISSATGESIPLSFLQEKFKLSEEVLINSFKELFDNNEITGQVNTIKKRYTKRRFGSDEAIVGETPVSSKSYELPPIRKGVIGQSIKGLESELDNFEDIFARINFPFEKYVQYQNRLLSLNFYELKQKIYSRGLESNKCVICFRQFNKKDRICDCGNDHYFHHNCIKVWLENQKQCPICDVDLRDNLKVLFFDTILAKDDLLSLQEIIARLKSKVNNLEEQLKKRQEQIFLMREYSEKDKSIFEKLMGERDNKHLLEKELNKSNRLIEELRSLLEIIKR